MTNVRAVRGICSLPPRKNNLEFIVFEVISNLCAERSEAQVNVAVEWPCTREISELCDLNIYKTRYFLLKLYKKGLVECISHPQKKSLRWKVDFNGIENQSCTL